jgi:hypothetical protein
MGCKGRFFLTAYRMLYMAWHDCAAIAYNAFGTTLDTAPDHCIHRFCILALTIPGKS